MFVQVWFASVLAPSSAASWSPYTVEIFGASQMSVLVPLEKKEKKLDRVAPLMTDPPQTNFNNNKNYMRHVTCDMRHVTYDP